MTRDTTPKTLRALLHTIVDYAGLFPPANLDMDAVVRNYDTYRADRHAWMLGRLVVPVARLDELAETMRGAGVAAGAHHWRVSALAGADFAADVASLNAFNARGEAALVDAIEVKASGEASIRAIAAATPPGLRVYVEIPVLDDPRELVGVIAESKLRAKIRTGGVTPGAIPAPVA